jgi:2-polyprenyl-6-methoxyphenol hydroxylase-like FAD-dependent oxidoreductase
MAFEDSVVLCRTLKKAKEDESLALYSSTEEVLRRYENERLPRIRKLWADQLERSEKVYKNELMEPWSKEFSDWVFNGV